MIANLKLFSGNTLSTLLITCFSAQAQKLPGVQQTALRAPTQIKIDGRTTEWGNQLQAYNKATCIYYTLCNDDDNLYLTIQAKDPLIARKILSGGIVFTAKKSIKKTDEQIAVTFPLLSGDISEIAGYLKQRAALTSDQSNNIYQRDSLLLLMNTTLINNLKTIKVKGIKQFADTTLSVYNDAGIKARTLFDVNNALTCELAIPIKYLNLLTITAGFSYQIKVNEINANVKDIAIGLDGSILPSGSFKLMQSGSQAEQQILMNTTNFWGEYTLVGK